MPIILASPPLQPLRFACNGGMGVCMPGTGRSKLRPLGSHQCLQVGFSIGVSRRSGPNPRR